MAICPQKLTTEDEKCSRRFSVDETGKSSDDDGEGVKVEIGTYADWYRQSESWTVLNNIESRRV